MQKTHAETGYVNSALGYLGIDKALYFLFLYLWMKFICKCKDRLKVLEQTNFQINHRNEDEVINECKFAFRNWEELLLFEQTFFSL